MAAAAAQPASAAAAAAAVACFGAAAAGVPAVAAAGSRWPRAGGPPSVILPAAVASVAYRPAGAFAACQNGECRPAGIAAPLRRGTAGSRRRLLTQIVRNCQKVDFITMCRPQCRACMVCSGTERDAARRDEAFMRLNSAVCSPQLKYPPLLEPWHLRSWYKRQTHKGPCAHCCAVSRSLKVRNAVCLLQ